MVSRTVSAPPLPRLGIRRTIHRTPWLVLLLWLVAIALTTLVWVRAIESLTNPKPTTAQTRPQAFVWGDRVFQSKPLMEQWLRERGIAYSVWAKRHPAAVGIINPKLRRTAVTSAAKPKPKPKPTAKVASAQQPEAGGGGRSLAKDIAIGASVVLPFLAIMLAAGSTLYARTKRRWNRVLPMRTYLVGFAAAVAAGGLIAHAF